LTGKRLGGRGRGGSSGTWHAIAFDRRNPFVWVYSVNITYSHLSSASGGLCPPGRLSRLCPWDPLGDLCLPDPCHAPTMWTPSIV